MTSLQDRKTQTLIDASIVCGFAACLLYPAAMMDFLPDRVSNVAFMFFGPFLAVSTFGMRAFYARANDTATNDIAHLLLVLAGTAFTFMATMQMSIFTLVPQYLRAASEDDVDMWRAILRGVSSTQLGLDYAFDIFISSGAALLGWQIIRHPRVPSLIGYAGILIGLGGLAVNTWTFPENSGDAGLIDPSAFFGIWFGFAWLPLVLLRRWRPAA